MSLVSVVTQSQNQSLLFHLLHGHQSHLVRLLHREFSTIVIPRVFIRLLHGHQSHSVRLLQEVYTIEYQTVFSLLHEHQCHSVCLLHAYFTRVFYFICYTGILPGSFISFVTRVLYQNLLFVTQAPESFSLLVTWVFYQNLLFYLLHRKTTTLTE